ncbi:MAG: transposase [Microcystis sp. LE19-84.1B]|jgi:putative transposase|uniref:transposase n=1 Tax=Microcystis sp. LE19-84.1B TaxID=3016438 RepID=UPI0022BFDBB6|nr:transposase [Microcystis sp. LE19-84.1B]MCZ8222753.1 transposase [Microcystis sp. LE19-84.1B]
MSFDPEKHHRRSIRLNNYDYGQPGAYFVTLCAYRQQFWFGEIKNHQMRLNQIGKIVAYEWVSTCKIRPNFQLDQWIIMPNHLHGIVIITDYFNNKNQGDLGARNAPLHHQNWGDLGARNAPLHHQNWGDLGARNAPLHHQNWGDLGARNAPLQRKPNSLSSFIAGFKSAVTRRINLLRQNKEIPIWQRNYYESIIRDEKSLSAIREYIINNPKCWQNDPENLQIEQQSQELCLDLFF